MTPLQNVTQLATLQNAWIGYLGTKEILWTESLFWTQCFKKCIPFYSIGKIFEKHLRRSNVVELDMKIKNKDLLGIQENFCINIILRGFVFLELFHFTNDILCPTLYKLPHWNKFSRILNFAYRNFFSH